MPPISSEEPRYNEIDLECRSTLPGSSTNGTQNGGSNAPNNEPVDQEELQTPQIDPPKGFEPTAASTSTSNANNIKAKRPSSSSSSSRDSSLSYRDTTNNLNDESTHVSNTGQQSGDSSSSNDNQLNPAIDGDMNNRRTEPSGTQNLTNQSRPERTINSRISNSKELQPTPSTSTQRFVTGLNNIVTKITKAFANTSLSLTVIGTDRCFQDEIPRFAFGHRRSLDKTWKLMDKVVKCCQHPRMNLNNSPPFILDVLPETYTHLKLIHLKYDSSHSYPHNDNEYSQVFLTNLQNRCKQTLKLFKDAKEEMFNEESDYRHKLTRNTLVFNHILSELKAIFPNGQFIGDKYLITKKESAGEFWKNSFGSSVLVDWKTFYHALQQVHSIDSSFFSLHALKQTIDLTCDEFISIFEFDVFTRLFQPWSTLLRNWQILAVTHPGYKAFLTYDELKARLQKHINKPGSYVFRLSCTRLGQWAIGYVTHDGQILQTIVQNISLSQALTESKFYLYPDGKDEDPSLSVLCSGMAGDERNVTVTEEQYEIYCGVGNSFQTCKICFENDKDIRVEPCNHLLCTSCLLAWQESEGQGCPYCRTEIKETVQITMDFPKSNH